VVGVIVLGFGASLPEFSAGFLAAARGRDGLALGNAVGSGVATVALALGVAALVRALPTGQKGVSRAAAAAVLAAGLWAVFGLDGVYQVWEGGVLLAATAAWAVWTIGAADQAGAVASAGASAASSSDAEAGSTHSLDAPWGMAWLGVGLGVVGLAAGADLAVWGASSLAAQFGATQDVIGVVALGPGSTLEEVAACAVAAWRKRADLAIGNVLGGIVFTAGMVGGGSVLAGPLQAPSAIIVFHNPAFVLAALIAAAFAVSGRSIGRLSGAALLLLYLIYLWATVFPWSPA
jgi:cation:H+ antiporter